MNHPIIGVPNFDPYPSKDGFITNMVVYPSTCAVFGYDIRQAIGGDFGFSRRAAEAFLAQTWPAKVFGLRKPATKKQKMTPHLMDKVEDANHTCFWNKFSHVFIWNYYFLRSHFGSRAPRPRLSNALAGPIHPAGRHWPLLRLHWTELVGALVLCWFGSTCSAPFIWGITGSGVPAP